MQSRKTDAQIQQDVLDELKWDTRVEATDVGVEVDKGVVTLTGTVSSYAKRLAAREAAHRVAGVLDVADDIEVNVPGAARHTDTEIAQAVRQALVWNTFVPEEHIRSTVTDGIVTLEGQVERWSQRADAEQAIRNLRSVKGVLNNLTVAGQRTEAQSIRKAIERALERRIEREAREIKVQVHDGTVTLSGNVHSWNEQQAVIRAAQHAPGVHAVKDELRIDLFA